MRIIRGRFKGKKINAPAGLPARPTTDFAKEGLFNLLENRIEMEGLKVLDLFSGTGNISFEFASRGAADITSVEVNFKAADFIRKTAGELKIENFRAIKQDVFKFIGFTREKFDIIFADPPYDLPQGELIPKIIYERELLVPEGMMIMEHSDEKDFSGHPWFTEKRIYGKVNFTFFICPENPSA
jgi:16S rRNA (guanine966-N2)-methyltransferase